MSRDRYEFLPRPDDEDAVIEELKSQELNFQQKFYDFVYATNDHGWDQREHLETLDDVYQTYVLMVGGDKKRRAILTREAGQARYYYLGLTTARSDEEAKEEAYLEACKAHGLNDPKRAPNPQRA